MVIRPGVGIGPFLFGMTEPELVRELGAPDKRYRTDSGVERLQYFGLRVEFAIEPENGNRFGWVEVHHPNATLFGLRVIGELASKVVHWLAMELGEEPEYDDLEWLETYFYPLSWVELHVDFGRVESVNYGVVYNEDNEPRWPSAEQSAAADRPRE